ncbi:TetR-like C-terminal domain-containing protein [Ruania zhangjianzhongii]|uniref:TetR-like C-terminal domain-containing protein n=1 Tax=Ruania zhangjianzhongii TaxID=2603206 RepID=UPI0022A83C30|nr:TetR-like C-terminal domain-containing protein [Ruania zhangjianzhongii]
MAELYVPPPFALLTQALDQMAATGLLSASARQEAEWPCWAAVHGFAHLVSDGPLRSAPDVHRRRLAEATVDAIIDGVCAAPPARLRWPTPLAHVRIER